MLNNLEKVRKQKGVTLTDMADLLHVRYQTISDKINGVSDFKFSEAILIHDNFFSEYDLTYLFTKVNKELQTT
ncbi:helix-turn-helix domain-containing protein [Carnobacterium divergens]|uniref:helix-turn-helix domain-containing protein n=1 Tax=Carnobacterium divergens TaxID=2748 RepID=UPI0028916259|nr:helix-turn-helix transcriptional regulator [Carnobacterium divergens]MDT1950095.1 helix-turn-helix domain-containing protein [Carnobacterium divergens]MDT1955273.1 helix-turn-helix domain-containing protein [Carnobacterium divergens]MDT1960511.1 helix-turn-helix domain-containing protein [Carnobacterium divergens]MDT1963055.1 helix-turn-helix domain-containing protein [Carnobacterium divergens]